MRNDNSRWPEPTRGQKSAHDSGDVKLYHVTNLQQTLLSGPRDKALNSCSADHAIGWPEIALTDTYAISLRRDRILTIGTVPEAFGWDEKTGLAISDASSNYEIIDISGVAAMDILRTGTELSLDQPSNSALRLWNGYGCILYRHDVADKFRMHITSAYFEGAWDMLLRQISLVLAHRS